MLPPGPVTRSTTDWSFAPPPGTPPAGGDSTVTTAVPSPQLIPRWTAMTGIPRSVAVVVAARTEPARASSSSRSAGPVR